MIAGHAGAQKGNRTLDLFITSEMLYRLSYLGDAEMLAGRRVRAYCVSRGVANFVPGR